MFSNFISREIGSALAMYEKNQLNYFRFYYEDKINKQKDRLNTAKDKFLESLDSNSKYLNLLNNYRNGQMGEDETALFYSQRDKVLTELMNDKHNKVANKLWKEMHRTEELVFDIRNSIYGGRAETKYHIGIQVKDGKNKLLKSYELDPKQMLRLQNNRGIFQAEVSTTKGIENFDFSMRFTTKKGLTAESLIKAITSEGGQGINGKEYTQAIHMADFLKLHSAVKSGLEDMSAFEDDILKAKEKIEAIRKERIGVGYKTEANQQKRKEINERLQAEKKKLDELMKSQNRAINFGYGRGFEALERSRYNLDFMPNEENKLFYNDNTSWVMQQDVNFIDRTDQAKLIMIQNKFFAEHSYFSTISMSSLFSSLQSLTEYFTMSDQDYKRFEEMSILDQAAGRRLDQDVYSFLQDEIVGSLKEDTSGNSESGWQWKF